MQITQSPITRVVLPLIKLSSIVQCIFWSIKGTMNIGILVL